LHELQGSMPFVSARNLAKLAGKIISMAPVLGNVCLLQTKTFYRLIEARLKGDSYFDALECDVQLKF